MVPLTSDLLRSVPYISPDSCSYIWPGCVQPLQLKSFHSLSRSSVIRSEFCCHLILVITLMHKTWGEADILWGKHSYLLKHRLADFLQTRCMQDFNMEESWRILGSTRIYRMVIQEISGVWGCLEAHRDFSCSCALSHMSPSKYTNLVHAQSCLTLWDPADCSCP